MDDLKLIQNVVARFRQAVPVVRLPQKPRVPTVTISGKKYNLSDYIGPTGSDFEEGARQGPSRLIENPHANKWRYLWVYDLDSSTVVMWRVSDGDEKFWGSANGSADIIARLEKKGHLNRVSKSEFHRIEAEMKRRYNETMEALEKSVAESKDELTKQVDKLVEDFFDSHVAPKLDKALSSVERGATPLGFDFNERVPVPREHQMLSFAFYQTMKREMTQGAVEKYLRSKGIDVEEAGQWIDWAIQDVNEKAYRVYIPREGLTAFKYVPKETKAHKVERITQYIKDATGLTIGMSEAIADAFVRGRDVPRLAIPKSWPIDGGIIEGPKGNLPLDTLHSLN